MRVAVVNQKGGVGKTTTAINVAGVLAAGGDRVLLVDADPQGHATEGVGLSQVYRTDGANLYTALTESATIADQIVIGDVVTASETGGRLDVIPSHIEMTVIEKALNETRGREFRLEQVLDALTDSYDHVVIDCPPNLGSLTDNAILAAENVLIPVEADRTSQRAVELLFDTQIDPIEANLSGHLDGGIEVVGFVANAVRTSDNESQQMVEWFDAVSDDIPVWVVFQRVALERAWGAGEPVSQFDEETDVEVVFEDIAREMRGDQSVVPSPLRPFESEPGAVDAYIQAFSQPEQHADSGREQTETTPSTR